MNSEHRKLIRSFASIFGGGAFVVRSVEIELTILAPDRRNDDKTHLERKKQELFLVLNSLLKLYKYA